MTGCISGLIAGATPSGTPYRAEIHPEHPFRQSCWVAARATRTFATIHNQEERCTGTSMARAGRAVYEQRAREAREQEKAAGG
jgi:hypothetical protein